MASNTATRYITPQSSQEDSQGHDVQHSMGTLRSTGNGASIPHHQSSSPRRRGRAATAIAGGYRNDPYQLEKQQQQQHRKVPSPQHEHRFSSPKASTIAAENSHPANTCITSSHDGAFSLHRKGGGLIGPCLVGHVDPRYLLGRDTEKKSKEEQHRQDSGWLEKGKTIPLPSFFHAPGGRSFAPPAPLFGQLAHGETNGTGGQSYPQRGQGEIRCKPLQNAAVVPRKNSNRIDQSIYISPENPLFAEVLRNELNGFCQYISFPKGEELTAIMSKVAPAAPQPGQPPSTPNIPIFFGQVLFSATKEQLTWMIYELAHVVPTIVTNHSPGCWTGYFKSDSDCAAVLELHKRILFDQAGVWVAKSADQTRLLRSPGSNQTRRTGICKLPRAPLVVEVPAHTRKW